MLLKKRTSYEKVTSKEKGAGIDRYFNINVLYTVLRNKTDYMNLNF